MRRGVAQYVVFCCGLLDIKIINYTYFERKLKNLNTYFSTLNMSISLFLLSRIEVARYLSSEKLTMFCCHSLSKFVGRFLGIIIRMQSNMFLIMGKSCLKGILHCLNMDFGGT